MYFVSVKEILENVLIVTDSEICIMYKINEFVLQFFVAGVHCSVIPQVSHGMSMKNFTSRRFALWLVIFFIL